MALRIDPFYLLPVSSAWPDWTDVDPVIRFQEAMTACSLSVDKPLLVAGDTNSRVGDRLPRGSTLGRLSSDTVVNTRGRWFLRLCSDLRLLILNGTAKEFNHPGAFTSFQLIRSSVIDFIIATPGLLPRIQDRSIRITQMLDWSDHAQIEMKIAAVGDRLYGPPRAAKPVTIEFGPATALDTMAEKVLKLVRSHAESSRLLYGPVFPSRRGACVPGFRHKGLLEFGSFRSTRDGYLACPSREESTTGCYGATE
ncbi:hypothetical protein GGX14DRAFT_674305 [Mycena pura]|uniref:Endonuclease/exonuclease/phosphatase domain-containing protein n=1 Tax=Mycena pura TaxID=153505 RepID=A0AAD6Y0U5_9AGAR|nr:hypothetical protein GGX14DRAFT_674305 [Mycena pura]